jgi:tetratricopeptide (TPR) repeat protein
MMLARSIVVLTLWPSLATAHELAIAVDALEEPVRAAIVEAHRALDDDEANAQAWGRLGMVLHAHRFERAAAAHYDEALAREPNDYRWSILAAETTKSTEPTRAARYFAHAMGAAPPDAAPYLAYGNLLTRLGRFAEAQAQFDRALDLSPSSSHARIGLARIALTLGDLDDAAEFLQEARAYSPRNGEIHALLAQVHARLGKPAEAERAAATAKAYPFRFEPRSPLLDEVNDLAVNADALRMRADRLVKRGRFTEAVETFRAALDARPGDPRSLAGLATALTHAGRGKEASAMVTRALAEDPDSQVLVTLARVMRQTGEDASAVDLLGRAVLADPANAAAHLELGKLAHGEPIQAIAHLERALALDPSVFEAELAVGLAYAELGEHEKALAHWRALLRIEPDHVGALAHAGRSQAYLGDHASSAATLHYAHAIDSGNEDVAYLLGWLLAGSGDPGVRDPTAATAIASDLYRRRQRDPARAALMAASYAANGRFERAVALAERAGRNPRATPDLVADIEAHLERFRAGGAVVEPAERCGDHRSFFCRLLVDSR